MAEANDALQAQLLAWIAERPRTYGEAIEAWRSSCPRLTIWEDAEAAGLFVVGADGRILLTERGESLRGDAASRLI